jgi:hypothetical protein
VACLYENIRETIEAGFAGAPASVRERILRKNSAALYRIDDPTPADLTRMAQFAA